MPSNLPWDGGCRCGRVRFRVTKAPMLTMACHCFGCQSMSASAFSLSMAIPLDGLELTKGETVVGGLHGEPAHHQFCAWCMTWMFTRVEQFGLVNVRPTMLDHHQDFVPFIETQTAEKLPWATTPAVHSFARFPAMDDYQRLTAEYLAGAGAA